MATRKTAAPTVATPKKAPRRERTRLAAKVDWRPAFLADLAEWCNVTHACAAAGVDRKTAYKDRAHNPDFAAAWVGVATACGAVLYLRRFTLSLQFGQSHTVACAPTLGRRHGPSARGGRVSCRQKARLPCVVCGV